MAIKDFIICSISLIVWSSCSADVETENMNVIVPPSKESEAKGDYNILIIGNSLSRDAFSYVPGIINEICPNLSLGVDILYIGGVGLNSHWNYISNDIDDYILDDYDSENKHWRSIPQTIGADVINSKKWDLVVLQEGSITARNFENTHKNIDILGNYMRGIHPGIKIAYMMVPAQPRGSSYLGNYSSDEVWSLLASTAEELRNNHDVDYLIPCGTAIQNARYTFLNKYGDFGDLSYDGRHLQEGVPCLVDAYAAVQSILTIIGIEDVSIYDSI